MGEVKAPEATQVSPVRPAFGVIIRWPTTAAAWAGLIILVALDAWFLYAKQLEGATLLTGYILTNLGLSAQQAAAISFAVNASAHATRAADVAQEAAVKNDDKLTTLTEAVKDIQENPAQPGTPGWMERNAPPH